jgi:hypothetical protein
VPDELRREVSVLLLPVVPEVEDDWATAVAAPRRSTIHDAQRALRACEIGLGDGDGFIAGELYAAAFAAPWEERRFARSSRLRRISCDFRERFRPPTPTLEVSGGRGGD